MKCKDCANFRRISRVEAGEEITPGVRTSIRGTSIRGTCSINNARCRAEDECKNGGFTQL